MSMVAIFLVLASIKVFRSEKQLMLSITLLIFFSVHNINIGRFASIGGVTLTYTDYLTALAAMVCVVNLFRNSNINRRMFVCCSCLTLAVSVSLLYLILNPADVKVMSYFASWDSYFRGVFNGMTKPFYSIKSLLQFIRMLLFLCILMVSKSTLTETDWKKIIQTIVISSRWMLPLYYIELITRLVGSDIYYRLRAILFGTDIMPDGRLSGLSTEPSYLAVTIFMIVAINMMYSFAFDLDRKEKLINKGVYVLYFLIGCLSASFSFVWAVVVLLALYCIIKNKKRFNVILTSIFILVVILLSFNFNIIFTTINNSDNLVLIRISSSIQAIIDYLSGQSIIYTSEGTRLVGVIMTLKAWCYRPLLGLGIGTLMCFSGVVSILATIGILGFIIWYNLLFNVYPNRKVSWAYNILFLIFFLPLGDFDLFYNFNIVIWIQTTNLLEVYCKKYMVY